MADWIVGRLTGADDPQDKILWRFLAGLISAQDAAGMLASHALTVDDDPVAGVYDWLPIMLTIRAASEERRQLMLVDLLVRMANLPPVRDVDGVQLEIHGFKIWGEDE